VAARLGPGLAEVAVDDLSLARPELCVSEVGSEDLRGDSHRPTVAASRRKATWAERVMPIDLFPAVEKNWSALFGGIPDFRADLLTTASAGETLWAEWHWTGTRENEAPFEMRGVTVFEISNGRIVAGRLYMEEVEEAGADIDETVRRLAEGTRSEPGTS